MTLARIISLLFVMIAGPHRLSAIFFATNDDRRQLASSLAPSRRTSSR